MSSFSQEDPRANQKARTREAIVDAAQQLHRQGRRPTIAQAAEQARVSRATAYRYFPTQEALMVEVTGVTPRVVEVEKLLGSLTTEDVERRLLLLLETFGQIALAEEAEFRTALLVYLDTWLRSHRNGNNNNAPDVREGRRMRWLDKVLEPLDDLPEEQKRRLRAALALTMGMDSIVIMKDVCRLDDHEALAVLRWVATVLLRAGLEEGRASASTP
jgi:AcrR family transcriptional regulator